MGRQVRAAQGGDLRQHLLGRHRPAGSACSRMQPPVTMRHRCNSPHATPAARVRSAVPAIHRIGHTPYEIDCGRKSTNSVIWSSLRGAILTVCPFGIWTHGGA